MPKKVINKSTYKPVVASLIIRISLAIVFGYAAIGAFVQPIAWIGYIPDFVASFIDPKLALDGLSVVQLLLAIWLISGKYIKFSAGVSIAFLTGILFTSPGAILITFRDIGLIGAAVGLIYLDE